MINKPNWLINKKKSFGPKGVQKFFSFPTILKRRAQVLDTKHTLISEKSRYVEKHSLLLS